MAEWSPPHDQLVEEVRHLPPSAKLVCKILQHEGALTNKELTEETMLPSRTVREATTTLEEDGIITSRTSFMDARQSIYALAPALHEMDSESTHRPQ